MKFSVVPTSTAHAANFTVVVDLENPTSSDSVTISIGTNPSSGVLSGTTTKASVNGVALFTNLQISLAGVGYTLIATAPQQTMPTNPPAEFQPGVVGHDPHINQFQAGYYFNYPPSGDSFPHNTVFPINFGVHGNVNVAPVMVSITSNPITLT